MWATGNQNSCHDLADPVIEDILSTHEYIHLVISLSGIAGNAISIFIFWRMGLNGSTSVNLFALSLADLLTTFFAAAVCICALMHKMYPSSNVDGFTLAYFLFRLLMNSIHMTSCCIPAEITVEKCFCLVFPFKVKLIFTRFNSVIIILIIYLLLMNLPIPMYIVYRPEWIESPHTS